MKVAAFTDTYLPTVNGVSYTVAEWKSVWDDQYGSMDVFHPDSGRRGEGDGEIATRSVPFPFYDDFQIGFPVFPSFRVGNYRYDVIHAHTPFTLGLSGLRYAKRSDAPFVLSYHTPVEEYATYLPFKSAMEQVARKHQDLMFRAADRIIVPTAYVKDVMKNRTETPISVLSNGINTELFQPTEEPLSELRGVLSNDRPTIGYTGRLCKEKNVRLILDELGDEDIDIVIGGDGPTRGTLQERAASCSANVVFPGFVERDQLPALYSTLDVFAFPSPVETQGKVALEAISCGTPVVGVDNGALPETIDSGVTGEVVSAQEFGDTVLDVCEAAETYRPRCLEARDTIGVEASVEQLRDLYRTL